MAEPGFDDLYEVVEDETSFDAEFDAVYEPYESSWEDVLNTRARQGVLDMARSVPGVQRMAAETQANLAAEEMERPAADGNYALEGQGFDPEAFANQKLRRAMTRREERPMTAQERQFAESEIYENVEDATRADEAGRAIDELISEADAGAIVNQEGGIAPYGKPFGSMKAFLGDVVRSTTGYTLPSMAAGMLSGPYGGAAAVAFLSGTQKYEESRRKGRSYEDAMGDAAVASVTEGVPEVVPMTIVLKRGTPFFARFINTMVANGLQEGATEIMQMVDETTRQGQEITLQDALTRVSRASAAGIAQAGPMTAITGARDNLESMADYLERIQAEARGELGGTDELNIGELAERGRTRGDENKFQPSAAQADISDTLPSLEGGGIPEVSEEALRQPLDPVEGEILFSSTQSARLRGAGIERPVPTWMEGRGDVVFRGEPSSAPQPTVDENGVVDLTGRSYESDPALRSERAGVSREPGDFRLMGPEMTPQDWLAGQGTTLGVDAAPMADRGTLGPTAVPTAPLYARDEEGALQQVAPEGANLGTEQPSTLPLDPEAGRPQPLPAQPDQRAQNIAQAVQQRIAQEEAASQPLAEVPPPTPAEMTQDMVVEETPVEEIDIEIAPTMAPIEVEEITADTPPTEEVVLEAEPEIQAEEVEPEQIITGKLTPRRPPPKPAEPEPRANLREVEAAPAPAPAPKKAGVSRKKVEAPTTPEPSTEAPVRAEGSPVRAEARPEDLNKLTLTQVRGRAKKMGVPVRKDARKALTKRMRTAEEAAARLKELGSEEAVEAAIKDGSLTPAKIKEWADALFPRTRVAADVTWNLNLGLLQEWGAKTGQFTLKPRPVKKRAKAEATKAKAQYQAVQYSPGMLEQMPNTPGKVSILEEKIERLESQAPELEGTQAELNEKLLDRHYQLLEEAKESPAPEGTPEMTRNEAMDKANAAIKAKRKRKPKIKEPDAEYSAIVDDPEPGTTEIWMAETKRPSKVLTEFLSSRAGLKTTGRVKTGMRSARSADAAAHMIAPIRKNPQEQMVALVLDKDYKPITIIRHTSGLPTSSMVSPTMLVGAIARVKGAKHVWFAHNHPSNSLKQSEADVQMQTMLDNMLEGSGIESMGMLVVGPGRTGYTVTSSSRVLEEAEGEIAPAARDQDIPVKERTWARIDRGGLAIPLTSNERAVSYFDANPDYDNGVLMMDSQLKPVGWVPLSLDEMAELRTGDPSQGATRVYSAFEEANATAAFVRVGVDPYQLEESANIAPVNNLLYALLGTSDIRVMDVIAGEPGDALSLAHASALPEAMQEGRGTTQVFLAAENIPRRYARPKSGIRFGDLRNLVGRMRLDNPGAPRIVAVRTQADLPFPIQSKAILDGEPGTPLRVMGAWMGDTVYVVAENLSSTAHAKKILAHEVVGHFSLEQMLGDVGMEELAGRIQRLKAAGDARVLALANQVQERSGVPLSPREEASEIMAMVAELRPAETSLQSLLRWMRQAVRQFLRAIGLGTTFSATDIDILISQATSRIRNVPAYDAGLSDDIRLAAEPTVQGRPIEDKPTNLTPGRDYTEEQLAALHKIDPEFKVQTWAEKVGLSRGRLGEWFLVNAVDQFRALRRLGDRAWMLARMTKAAMGAIEAAFLKGKIFVDADGAMDLDPQGQSLIQALEPLGNEIDDFFGWMVGNRAEQLWNERRERLFDEADRAGLMALNQGTMADGRSRANVYEQARLNVNAWVQNNVDIAEQLGTIDPAERATWQDDFYLPFYRVLEDNKGSRGPISLSDAGLTGQTAFKRLKGGKQALGNPLHNLLLNANHLIQSGLNNQAANEALDKAVEVGIAQRVLTNEELGAMLSVAGLSEAGGRTDKIDRLIDAGQLPADYDGSVLPMDRDVVWTRKGGQKEYYQVNDHLVMTALTALSYNGMNNATMRGIRAFKRVFTMGVTASPEFRIANLIRDSLHAMATTPLSKNPLSNVVQGVKLTDPASDLRARMLASGAEMHFGFFYGGGEPEAAKLAISRAMRQHGIENVVDETSWKTRNPFVKGGIKAWNWWEEFGSRVENVNRAALYQQLRDDGASHFEASFAARDLIDFSQSGSAALIRFLTQAVPFLNARIQGLDKTGRSLTDPKQRGQFMAVFGALVLASTALYFAQHDEEWYKARTEEDKDLYYAFRVWGSNTVVRIPKPFEIGAFATLLSERLWQQVLDDEANSALYADRLWHVISEQLNFFPSIQAISPILEIRENTDPFRQTSIEPEYMRMQGLSADQKRHHWTSQTAIGMSSAINTVLWKDVELSPIQVEYLVNGYLGWIGRAGLAVSDGTLQVLGVGPPEADWRIEDYPVAGRFIRDIDPPRGTAYEQRFYDWRREVNGLYADMRNMKRLNNAEGARQLRKDARSRLRHRKYLNNVGKQLSTLRAKLIKIHMDPTLTGGQKRKMIDDIQRRRQAILYRAYQRVEPAFNRTLWQRMAGTG